MLDCELITGRKLTGKIRRFDRFAVVLEPSPGDEVLIYKHAIKFLYKAEDETDH